jgi:hypothetical protein
VKVSPPSESAGARGELARALGDLRLASHRGHCVVAEECARHDDCIRFTCVTCDESGSVRMCIEDGYPVIDFLDGVTVRGARLPP